MDLKLVINLRLCDACGLCAEIAPGAFDPSCAPAPVEPTVTALIAMDECPAGAIEWASPEPAAP